MTPKFDCVKSFMDTDTFHKFSTKYGLEGLCKLLTLHRRGYGVDVEALRDRFPLRQIAGKGPKMGSHGYTISTTVTFCIRRSHLGAFTGTLPEG